MRAGTCVLFFIILAVLPAVAFSLDFEGLYITAGSAIILNREPVTVSPAPAPSASMFGISVPMTFTDIFYFEPGLRFYGTSVILTSENKAVPAAIETADRVSVLNCEIRPEVGAVFSVTDQMMVGFTGAPVFTFRFPVKAYDAAADSEQKALVREYYYSAARFLGFYAGGFLSWQFGEHTAFRLKVGTNLPVYHIWDNDDAGFLDQLIIEPELGMVFRF